VAHVKKRKGMTHTDCDFVVYPIFDLVDVEEQATPQMGFSLAAGRQN
jgi:hypothetical protein